MSDTESFESVMEAAMLLLSGECAVECRHDKHDDCLHCAAHMAERLKRAHDREIRDVTQQQYHRGYEDGQHSMDAEHRAIAMRLRGLRFDGGSHENLSRVAYAIYPCVTGWTCESTAGLRDKLIDLMGGVSEPSAADQALDLMNTIIKESNERLQNDGKTEIPSITGVSDENVHVGGLRCDDGCMGDVSNGEDTWRTHDSPSNLDRNHMDNREGVDTVIGDSDDTCCCAGGGACADCDGRDSGEHAEVSDDCVDCDILGPDSRGHAVDCDFHELGVSDGGTADDSPADFRGRTGCDVVHMDGLVAYDVLDNERRKAIVELQRIVDEDKPITMHGLADAIGMNLCIGDRVSIPICMRLIHLLGGDQPSGIDVLRAMDERDAEGRITDELRERITGVCKVSGLSGEKLYGIADRIDAQFDRICQQHEAVLQSTIDEMVDDRDNLLDLLRDATKEYVNAQALCDELRYQREELMRKWMHERAERKELQGRMECTCKEIESAQHERDELRDEDFKIKRQYAELCVERADLLDLLRDARKEYMRLRTENQIMLEDMRRRQAKLDESEHERDELRRKVDELESFDPETSIAAFGDDNGKLRGTLSRAATLLANAEQDRDANYAYWMDCKEKVVHANATIEELQAKLDAIRDALDG